MNKTEILNIVNEPSKHIQIIKIDGEDSIVYSSKFVKLLELIPNMLTVAEVVGMLDKIRDEIAEIHLIGYATDGGKREIASRAVMQIIDKYKAEIVPQESEDK